MAEKGVQFFCNTSANLLHERKIQMVSDWPKTQKKPPRTNQTSAVLTTKFKKTAMVSCKQRFDFVRKTTIEKLKKHSKKPEHGKKYVFLAQCFENAVLREKYCQQKRGK